MIDSIEPIEIDSRPFYTFRYSVCTLVTDKNEYQEMLNSFYRAGFNSKNSEFLYIDNSCQNKAEAYSGLNALLCRARGEFVILCHQDVLLEYDTIHDLDKWLDKLEQIDPKWAVAGNAGGIRIKKMAKHFVNRFDIKEIEGPKPALVGSIDENFMIVKKKANLSFSCDLSGFHLYGTDICMIAQYLGYSCYVIGFLLKHKGIGRMGKPFYELQNKFILKHSKARKSHFVQTTCTRFYISASPIKRFFFNSPAIMFFARAYFKLKNLLSR